MRTKSNPDSAFNSERSSAVAPLSAPADDALGRFRRMARVAILGALAAAVLFVGRAQAQNAVVNFETPPVHPLDLSPGGGTLALTNTIEGRLEVFDMAKGVPIVARGVAVGVDPVTVRFRTATEAWVVNNISDTISVLDVAALRVVATYNTLDEPNDVVFVAGSPAQAYVSCAGVNTIQVLNATTGAEIKQILIKGMEPRSLALSPTGTKVYAAIFHSGNGTTLLGGGSDGGNVITFPPNVVSDPSGPYGGQNPPPNASASFSPPIATANPPKVGLIVRRNASGQWFDDNGADWSAFVSGPDAAKSGRPVGWDMADRDLAVIETGDDSVTYGTRLMNICMSVGVNPVNGRVYVIGTDAINQVRFEPNVKGIFTRVKVGITDSLGVNTVGVVDLNPHLTYAVRTIAQAERDKSIGDPRGIVWNAAGTRGYITGMGSNNMIVIDADGNRVDGTAAAPIATGQGPTGLVMDDARNRLYVYNRFDQTLEVRNAATLATVATVSYYDATPAAIRDGRPFFYDTHRTSGLGQISCESCHVDGKMDRLAWDLGDPAGTLASTSELNDLLGGVLQNIDANYHPMKGPMTTQTFQDIIGKEPLHWRGDRNGLEAFNGAFEGLQGDDVQLTPAEMAQYKAFVATIYFPPNPNRTFQNTLPTSLPLPGHFKSGRFGGAGAQLPNGNAVNGVLMYRRGIGTTELDQGAVHCVSCHSLPTGAGPDQRITSLFPAAFQTIPPYPLTGARHLAAVAIDGSTQDAIKVPQLRNTYKKLGMEMTAGHTDALAGFGVGHDGAIDSISRFVSEGAFSVTSDQDVADLVAFIVSFAGSDLPVGKTTGNILSSPIDLEPIGVAGNDAHAAVGKTVTIATNATNATIDAMIVEADENGNGFPAGTTRGVDIVVRGKQGGVERGWFYNNGTGGLFVTDRNTDAGVSKATLMGFAAVGAEQTWTVVPRGSGRRIGIDRDADGFHNLSEVEACSDPDDAANTPATGHPSLATNPAMPDASVNYGSVEISTGPSPGQNVTLSNNGSFDLKFTGAKIIVAGPDASDFIIVNGPATTALAPSQTRTVTIAFDPSTAGAKAAFLTIVSNDCLNGVINIPLSGSGVSGGPTSSPTPSITPSGSPTPTPTPTPTQTETPGPTPTAAPSATPTASPTPIGAGNIKEILLGRASAQSQDDLNGDGVVDIADLLAASMP